MRVYLAGWIDIQPGRSAQHDLAVAGAGINCRARRAAEWTGTQLMANWKADTYASYWTYQNRVYTMVINTSASRANALSLQVPVGTAGALSRFSLPDGHDICRWVAERHSLAYDVYVYVLDTGREVISPE
jgi:hypothetical protein